MNVRDATTGDREAIETVARASFDESYGSFVEDEAIETLVSNLYGPDGFGERLGRQSDLFLVAEDDEIVGFAEGALRSERPLAAELYWLHVAPERREEGISDHLVGQFQDRVRDSGAVVIRGMVLAGNEDGADYYRAHGFEHADTRAVDLGDQAQEELVFERPLGDEPDEQIVEAIVGSDDQELFVAYSESERGHEAPFFAVYSDDDLTQRYGYRCGNCESLSVTVDSMGRVRCENCGNYRKAARWDAVYL